MTNKNYNNETAEQVIQSHSTYNCSYEKKNTRKANIICIASNVDPFPLTKVEQNVFHNT